MAITVGIRQVLTVLPASDLDRARRFYSDKMGMTPRADIADGLFYEVGNGSGFLVYRAQGPASGQHTQAAFLVDDLDSVMSDLRSRGVTFEEYDLPGVHTDRGVYTTSTGRGAFIKDSEGNIIGLQEPSDELRTQMGL